jgi:Clr5 domain
MYEIWTSFAPLIKKLYQEERRTLKEVKTILEGEHAFPKTP